MLASEARKLTHEAQIKKEKAFELKVPKILNKIYKKVKRRIKCGGSNLILPHKWTDRIILDRLKENGYIVESYWDVYECSTTYWIHW